MFRRKFLSVTKQVRSLNSIQHYSKYASTSTTSTFKGRSKDDIPVPQPYSFVTNPDNIIGKETVSYINETLGNLMSNNVLVPVVVVIIRGMDNTTDIEAYAKRYYEQYMSESILIFVSAAEGMAVVYDGSNIMPEYKHATTIIQNKFRQAEFDSAMTDGIKEIASQLQQGANVAIMNENKSKSTFSADGAITYISLALFAYFFLGYVEI
jgi:uncharacterized membrane protein YgcG